MPKPAYKPGEATPISYVRLDGRLQSYRCGNQQLWAAGKEMHAHTYITTGDHSLQVTVQLAPEAPAKPPVLYECQDCGKEWKKEQLKEIPEAHYEERVGDGPEPDGECPKCGALCHAMDQECDDCHAMVASVIGCPDGAEICQGCFNAGRH